MEQISWIVTAASLVGTVLNIKKNKACFIIWTVTNAFWAGYDFMIGAYAQAALFATYFCLALWGMWEWNREAAQAKKPVPPPKGFDGICVLRDRP